LYIRNMSFRQWTITPCPSSLLRIIIRGQGFRAMSAGSIGRDIAFPKDPNLVSAKGGGVYLPDLSMKLPVPHAAKGSDLDPWPERII